MNPSVDMVYGGQRKRDLTNEVKNIDTLYVRQKQAPALKNIIDLLTSCLEFESMFYDV